MAKISLEFPDDNTSLNLLLWNYFGAEYPDVEERCLRANPALAALGVFPPKGTIVTLDTPSSPKTPAQPISLWTNGN